MADSVVIPLDSYSKGPRKRGNVVAETGRNISWVRKRVGGKKIVLLPCCANERTFAEEAKCFLKYSETFLLPQQMLRVR